MQQWMYHSIQLLHRHTFVLNHCVSRSNWWLEGRTSARLFMEPVRPWIFPLALHISPLHFLQVCSYLLLSVNRSRIGEPFLPQCTKLDTQKSYIGANSCAWAAALDTGLYLSMNAVIVWLISSMPKLGATRLTNVFCKRGFIVTCLARTFDTFSLLHPRCSYRLIKPMPELIAICTDFSSNSF